MRTLMIGLVVTLSAACAQPAPRGDTTTEAEAKADANQPDRCEESKPTGSRIRRAPRNCG